MRRIVSMLSEVRKLQLERVGAPSDRIAESQNMFRFLDHSLSGINTDGPETALSEVMTSGDFTHAIQEFVQRQMLPGYQTANYPFEPLMKMDTVPNFMLVSRYQRQYGLDDLEYVPEKGQARPGSYADATLKQYRVYKWEKQFDFSMELLVNDDLGYFNDTAVEMGRAARRTLERFASRMITNATNIARLIALGALYSTTGRLTTARISEARMAFNQRTDASGNPMPLTLKYLVIHPGLADVAAQIQASMLVPELATNAANIVRNTFTVIVDPYMVGTAPNLPWYAIADTAMGVSAFVLVRRAGVPGPMILRRKSDIESISSLLGGGTDASPIWGDFASSNIVVKVHDEWGTYINAVDGNMFDSRGVYYSSGTAA
jgi:hypothetical protein